MFFCQKHGVTAYLKAVTAGINRSNTAARAVLEQPCSTGGRTDTVRPKREPTGRTDLSDRSRLVLCNRSQELIGQACPTRRQMLRSDSACPTTGRTRLFEHRSNCRVRPVNAGTDHPDSKKLDLMEIGMGLWLFDGPSESDRSQHISRLGHDSCWYFCLALSGTRTTTRDISSVCAAPGQSDLMQFIRSRANRKNYRSMYLSLRQDKMHAGFSTLSVLFLVVLTALSAHGSPAPRPSSEGGDIDGLGRVQQQKAVVARSLDPAALAEDNGSVTSKVFNTPSLPTFLTGGSADDQIDKSFLISQPRGTRFQPRRIQDGPAGEDGVGNQFHIISPLPPVAQTLSKRQFLDPLKALQSHLEPNSNNDNPL
ncbi:hypothetical protein PCASD_12345 [Puccinia coronata f. sp. avenae]|uniref:Uncharacterized protein n=1 Tax=Puccinia coronata f. sp. avenae TaxID=200324 RepID=A0A2N5U895_9BASI|nr:hypothetical protein PCASD_12345 [Puccinia coronata f. sp. avenae]